MKNGPLKILLIEDNPADAEILRDMIERCGGQCTLLITDRLSSGLTLLEEEAFDAVFLDLGLPDSSGIETFETLQRRKPDVPVIVLTGMTDGELASKAISLGAQDYLVKGKFESEILYRSILYSIERKRNEVSIRERTQLSEELNRIDNLIHSTLDFDTMLRRLIAAGARAVGAEGSAIGLYQDEYYVIKYVYNLPDELVGRSVIASDLKGIRYAAGLRDVVAFNDAFNDRRLNLDMIRGLGIRCMMIAPFIVKGIVLGAMSFFSFSARFRFSDSHLEFARRLSASVSIALENARLYNALRDSDRLSRSRLSQLQAIYATAPIGLCFIDTRLRYVNINERLAEMHGVSAEKHIGRTIREVLPKLADIVEPHFNQVINTGNAVENVEIAPVAAAETDAEGSCWLSSYYPVTDSAGRIFGVNAVVQDITARKKMEEEIRHLANHDFVTGLPNRRLFIELVALELIQARRHGNKIAVFFLDLDRFKNINDTLGHDAGDGLLREVAAGLRTTIRASDTIARIGGDEFNILVTDINAAEDVADIARKVVDYFQKTFVIAGQELRVTASVGISVYPDDGDDIESLLRFADIAMYHAKDLGRDNYQFYNPEINIRSLERMRLEAWLGQSVERGQLLVYYQPQVDIKTGEVVCAEALLRWNHPELGLIDPLQFIPLAQETGFITAIDEWVLRSACNQVKVWKESNLPPVCVTVNLSARLFENPGMVDTIKRILDETGMHPDCLDIEITESMAMNNVERTAVRLQQLAKMGVHISIDDFGTGYSSLSYLKRLPIQRLKIDKSFVHDITTDPDDRTIIRAVTAMAHNMKMKVIAEGVETEEQLAFLRDSGCDEMQGFLYSRPLPAGEFSELVSSRTGWR